VWNVKPRLCTISRHYNYEYLNREQMLEKVIDCLPVVLNAIEPYVGKCGYVDVSGDLEFKVFDYTEIDFKLADEAFCEYSDIQVEEMERHGVN